MPLFVANHATPRRHRDSIREMGLLVDFYARPLHRCGVYVFNDEAPHPTYSRGPGACWWGAGPTMDVWQVAYFGPMSPDHYVENGYVLYERVPPECLSLITLITPDTL
jgi:hypothetical protein